MKKLLALVLTLSMVMAMSLTSVSAATLVVDGEQEYVAPVVREMLCVG